MAVTPTAAFLRMWKVGASVRVMTVSERRFEGPIKDLDAVGLALNDAYQVRVDKEGYEQKRWPIGPIFMPWTAIVVVEDAGDDGSADDVASSAETGAEEKA